MDKLFLLHSVHTHKLHHSSIPHFQYNTLKHSHKNQSQDFCLFLYFVRFKRLVYIVGFQKISAQNILDYIIY